VSPDPKSGPRGESPSMARRDRLRGRETVYEAHATVERERARQWMNNP